MKVPQKWITIGRRGFSTDNMERLLDRDIAGIRINTGHSSFAWIYDMLEKLCALGYPMKKVLLDIANSKTRIKSIDRIELKVNPGDSILIKSGEKPNRDNFSVNNLQFFDVATKNDIVYFGDGELECIIQKSDPSGITLLVETEGTISTNMSVGIKGKEFSRFTVREDEMTDINRLLEKYPVSLILSFVNTAEDVRWAKTNFPSAAEIIPKIETKQAVNHFHEILEESNTVLIGRGDLALAVGIEKIGIIQNYLVDEAHKHYCKVAVGTGTLDSLKNAEIPLRAEIIDITNSCLSGVDYIVLTSETGGSNTPYKAIDYLDRTLSFIRGL